MSDHLHAVTGEVADYGPQTLGEAIMQIAQLEDEIAGLTSTIRSQAAKLTAMRRNKAKEAKANPLWPAAKRVHDYWRETCDHPRSKFTADVFELVAPYVEEDGDEMCRRAIDGAAFDPFITARKNGSKKRHDGFDLIFRSRAKFEEFCNRAERRG